MRFMGVRIFVASELFQGKLAQTASEVRLLQGVRAVEEVDVHRPETGLQAVTVRIVTWLSKQAFDLEDEPKH
jgi:hypothetical protein